MPNPARLVVYDTDNKPLTGPVPINDSGSGELTGSEIHEFSHQVYTIEKDYFYALLNGVDFVRQHKPLLVVKPMDAMSVPLMSFLLKGTFLPKVEIRWYTYLDDYINLQEYFRMTMEHVRLHNVVMYLPDVKDKQLERYAHLEYLSFCYQKITWLYTKGTLLYTDIWNGGFFSELDEKDFGGKVRDALDELSEMAPVEGALQVTFTSGIFDIDPAEVAFNKKAKVSFTATFSREASMKERKVYAKLFAVCNGKTEDLCQVQEGRLSEGGEWSTTFTLRKPEALGAGDDKVEYYAVIENEYAVANYKSDSISTSTDEPSIYLYNETGEPLAGVAVELRLDGEVVKEYTSADDGRVPVEFDAGDGEYRLHLKNESIETAAETDDGTKTTAGQAQTDSSDEIHANQSDTDVSVPPLVLPNPPKENESVLLVVDEGGNPLNGVSFTIFKNNKAIGNVITDPEGKAVVTMDSQGDEYELVYDTENIETEAA